MLLSFLLAQLALNGFFTPVVHASLPEADALWAIAQEEFEKDRFIHAAQSARAFLAKHPSHSHAIDAQWLLGKSELALGNFDAAASALKSFIAVHRWNPPAIRARLDLALAYESLSKWDELVLLGNEIQDHTQDPLWLRSALLYKAQGYLELGKLNRAVEARDRASKIVLSQASGTTTQLFPLAHQAKVSAKIKISQCGAGNSTRKKSLAPLDEGDYAAALRDQGICFLENLKIFREGLIEGENSFADGLYKTLESQFSHFTQNCINPPNPSGKRTREELSIYQKENRPFFLKTCRTKAEQAVEIMSGFKELVPHSSLPYITRLILHIKDSTSLWN